MVCDLDKRDIKTCILRSPTTGDRFSWTCMLVKYQLSCNDVKLTLDLLVDDVSNVSYTLPANSSEMWISNDGLSSPFSLQFTASRYLVSTNDYENAFVSSVDFLPCPADTGVC